MKLKHILPIACALSFSLHSYTQVTIGSSTVPNPGSLLDLKETAPNANNVNANKGLALPRVNLTHRNDLYPMFQDPMNAGQPNSNYTGTDKADEDAKHIGLVVYNINVCDGFAKGVYVWDGKEWILLTEGEEGNIPQILLDGESQMTETNTLFQIPSGVGLQTLTSPNRTIQIKWTPSGVTTTLTVANTISGGLKFVSPNAPSNWSSPLTTNPSNLTYEVKDMSDIAELTPTGNTWDNTYVYYPFQTRETTVKFDTSTDECGESASRTFTFNQTNFALGIDNTMTQYWPSGSAKYKYNTGPLRHLITSYTHNYNGSSFFADSFWLYATTNAKWKASFQELTPDIMTWPYASTPKGQELTDGNVISENIDMTRDGARLNTGTDGYNTIDNLYKTAGVLKFEDTQSPARFAPIEVTFIQCSARNFDTNGIAYGDPSQSGSWGTDVLYHYDQDGNVFYSAHFGTTAGRWMTTNLGAKKFANGTTLNAYNGKGISGDKLVYAYPRHEQDHSPANNRPIPDADWGVLPKAIYAGHNSDDAWYPELGLLYSWYAATGRTGAPGSINQGQISGSTPGANEVETVEPGGKIQGICPDGWHLPSDREWNELERELYNNPKTYSNYTDAQIASHIPGSWNPSYETTTGARGANEWDNEGYSGIFKEICPVRDYGHSYKTYSYGYSKEPKAGGFNVMCTGEVFDNIMRDYGGVAKFWTSSKNGTLNAWIRFFSYDYGPVWREVYGISQTRLNTL